MLYSIWLELKLLYTVDTMRYL